MGDMGLLHEVYADTELTSRAKAVSIYLHGRANAGGESWYAINTIAADLNLSRSTVNRAIHDLIRMGRIERHPRFCKNGGRTSNLYHLRKD